MGASPGDATPARRRGDASARRALALALVTLTPRLAAQLPAQPSDPAPLVMGETFTLRSAVLGETRRINIYRAPGYDSTAAAGGLVLYLPDGGMAEDFLHVAGLLQVLAGNGSMRPALLVGIENTERRRDLTGPTEVESDRRIAPRVGGSGPFRRFLRTELMPLIRARYGAARETAIVGESLAGLFVVETLVREPELFHSYIAFDPSLWWNNRQLLRDVRSRRVSPADRPKVLYLASSGDGFPELTAELANLVQRGALAGVSSSYRPLPEETHATIYHPAALAAFRAVFAPAAKAP